MYKESLDVFKLKISSIEETDDFGFVRIYFEDEKFTNPLSVPISYVDEFNPKPGGYFIILTGGVGSYSDN